MNVESYKVKVTATSVTFTLTGATSGITYQFLVRLNGDQTTTVKDELVTATGNTVIKRFDGLTPGTAYAANVRQNHGLWIGREEFVTPALRPSNWEWESTIAAGEPIRLTAGEWNGFCGRINEFRKYKGMSAYSFTTVSPGDAISAATVNEARSAINGISGHGTLPSAAVKGGSITAAFFLGLRDALNNV